MTRDRSPWALALAASLVAGCFSADDFSDCTGPGQCGLDANGRGMICAGGGCVSPAVDADDPAAEVLEGEKGDLHPLEGRTVVIRAVDLNSQRLRVEADVIIIDGPINGQGRGYSGGEAGDGAAIGSLGEPGARGKPDREGVEGGGEGGEGGASSGANGENGQPGVYQQRAPCRVDFSTDLAGSGGGGGGGAAGGACLGSGGGMGGNGGGAILLRATRFIEVRGTIDARGAPGAAAGGANCPDGAVGGIGGGGSGGLIYLEAPTILFSEGARLDVSGADDAGGGLVTLFGAIEGLYAPPIGVGPEAVCLSE